MDEGARALLDIGVTELVPCVDPSVPLDEALEHAEENYRRVAAAAFSRLAASKAEVCS